MKPKKKSNIKKLQKYIYNNYYDDIDKIFKGELSEEEFIKELEQEIKLNGSMKGRRI